MSARIDINTNKQQEAQEDKEKRNERWQNTIGVLAVLAEIANVGILVEIIAKWIPRFAILAASSALRYLMAIADPLIYFFRASIRLARIIGRNVFHINFEEEEHDSPTFRKIRTVGDLISLTLFALAILTFAGFILTGPVGLTLAWGLSLSGLVPIYYFDYLRPAKKSGEKYYRYANNKEITQEVKERLKENYVNKKNSMILYITLLTGLVLLLICGTAAAFAPPFLAPILFYTSKMASLLLGAIACGRFVNFFFIPQCCLYRIEKTNGNLDISRYKKNYILVTNKEKRELHYITAEGRGEIIKLDNEDKFLNDLNDLEKKKWFFTPRNKIYLSEKVRNKLIPLRLSSEARKSDKHKNDAQIQPITSPKTETMPITLQNQQSSRPSAGGFFNANNLANNANDLIGTNDVQVNMPHHH